MALVSDIHFLNLKNTESYFSTTVYATTRKNRITLQSFVSDNFTALVQRGYLELDDGWITPLNGYQYKITPTSQSWDDGRRICQSWGGDLIVYGFQDIAIIE